MLRRAVTMEHGSAGRRALLGRMAGVLFLGSGLVTLATLPIATADENVAISATVSVVAIGVGIWACFAPWWKWHARASLILIPLAFALIALGNAYGGTDTHTYGVFFVIAFVWIGIAHGRWYPLAALPLAAIAYILPIYALPGDVAEGISSATLTLPICVLIGEALAWGAEHLERTEMALAHEQFMAERLRALDEMKDAFMSAISHELRTPITISRGHLEVLAADPDPDELRETVDLVIDELARMGRLVDDLTTLVSTEDEGFAKLEPIEIGRFVRDIGAKASSLLGDRLRVDDDLPDDVVKADPHRLAQALLNLLANAAQHTKGRGVVRLRVVEEPAWWRFEVVDEGGGVAAGVAPMLYEPFKHGPASAGTGLGLAIVRGIAVAHDGQTGVDNRPGHGATFWIRLPR